MKPGISTFAYTWSIGVPGYPPVHPMTARDLLDKAYAFGLPVVQIADNLPLDRLPERELAELLDCARERRIQVEVGTRGLAPDHLRRYLDLAVQFRSPILRVVIDTASHHPDPPEVLELLRPLQADFERAGVALAIENHDRFPAQVLANLVRALGNWAGVCLDTVNSFGALEGPRAVVAALGPLTVNLHVKDFTIFRASHTMGFTLEGRPAGQGMLDLPWLLGKLAAGGRYPNAIIELWTPPEAALEDTIEKEQRWAAESAAYLKSLSIP